MKLHDLRPPEGSNTKRTRVGRGIAAGKGKTAGRGTKGQKARAGGSIPPWFEGGQTPLHMRIPKLRGFKNRFKVEYEVVNVGAIAELVELGRLETGETDSKPSGKGKSSAPITINQDILRAVGLVRTLDKPLKVLGTGDLSTALFVVADAFSKSAVAKIEAAGGSVNVLEVPSKPTRALGVDHDGKTEPAASASAPDEDATTATADPDDAAPARGKRAARAAATATPAEDAPAAQTEPVTEPVADGTGDGPDTPEAAATIEADAPDSPTGDAAATAVADDAAVTSTDEEVSGGEALPTESADSNDPDAAPSSDL
jgi:large subunit ribosomal protein L15